MLSLSIDYAPLRASVAAVKRADRQLRKDINTRLRQSQGDWVREVRANTRTEQDRQAVRVGTRIAGGNPPSLVAMTSRRPLAGGLRPARDYYMVEFGSPREHGRRGQLPRRRSAGRIVYPAAARMAPLMTARWAQAIRDAYIDRARIGVEADG